MNTKELKIEIPQGYEIDVEKSTFEKIIFKKIETVFPKTWEEFCKQNPVRREYYINNFSDIADTGGVNTSNRNCFTDKNLLSTYKDAEAHLALIQLHKLRDVYRQGWVPDWNDKNDKYCIDYGKDIIRISTLWYSQYFLAFQSKEIAEEFLKNFRDLIEKAKDLI